MQIKLKTLKLQEMVSKAVKGASGNKMIPITSLLAIDLKENTLTLTTTDATNYLKVIERKVEGDDFYVVVAIDLFSKLVSKTSSEFITLTLNDNSLQFKGNGTYSIDLPLDEDGKLIRFPEYKFNDADATRSTINLSTVKQILSVNKAALAETMEMPCYTGYYVGDQVITTDTYKICYNDIKVMEGTMLLSAEMMSLLGLMTDEKIQVAVSGNKVLFTTESCVVFGAMMDELADYQVDAIRGLVQDEFHSSCKLPKTALLAVLDRLMLFVSPYDKNGIYLTFTDEGVMTSSKKATGSELIKYQGSENFKPFSCCVDIQMLKSQVAAQDGEVVEMYYGNDRTIKMVTGKVTQVIALLVDDREAEGNGEQE